MAEMLVRNDYLEADELEGINVARLDPKDANGDTVPEMKMAVHDAKHLGVIGI